MTLFSKSLNKLNKKDIATYIAMAMIAVIVFFVLGTEVPSVQKDTGAYTTINNMDGVMPIYPLYATLMHYLFGNSYFEVMVVFQGLFASALTILFVILIKKELELNAITTVILYCLSIMPFIIYLPRFNISQIILSESLAFPLTYLMMFFIIKSVYSDRVSYSIIAIVIAMVLYLIRSQLLIAILYTTFVFFIQLVRIYKNTWWLIILKVMLSMIVFAVSFKIAHGFQVKYLYDFVPRYNNVVVVVEQTDEDEEEPDTSLSSSFQIARLIWNRGLFLLRDEDINYYSDLEKRDSLKTILSSIREGNERGLLADNPIDWTKKWDDQGLLSEYNYDYAVEGLTRYYSTLYPDYSDVDVWITVKSDIDKFSKDAIVHHMDDLFILTFRLFFAGIQASIFFQPPTFYVICEVITLLLVILSVALLWLGTKTKCNSRHILYMACIGIVIYTGVVSIIHQPLQRYLVYFQGIYYIGMFTLVLELFNTYKDKSNDKKPKY